MKRLPAPDYINDGLQEDGSYQETDRDFGPKRDGRWYVSVTAAGHLTILVDPGFRGGDCDVWLEADGVAVEQGYAVGRAMDDAWVGWCAGESIGAILMFLFVRFHARGVPVGAGPFLDAAHAHREGEDV